MSKNEKVFATTQELIKESILEETRPIRKDEFEKYRLHFTQMMGVLQQQIISLDVTIALLIECNGRNFESIDNGDGSSTMRITPWTEDQMTSFRAEIKKRVEAIASTMQEKLKAQESRISL